MSRAKRNMGKTDAQRTCAVCGAIAGEHRPDCKGASNSYAGDKAKLLARLHRIEGQVKAIERMIEGDRYCVDVLTQISAVNSALKSTAMVLLEDHLDQCVRQGVEAGGEVADDKLNEVAAAVGRLLRS